MDFVLAQDEELMGSRHFEPGFPEIVINDFMDFDISFGGRTRQDAVVEDASPSDPKNKGISSTSHVGHPNRDNWEVGENVKAA